MTYTIDMDVLDAVHGERVYQNRRWGTITERPHEVGGYLTIMRKLLGDAEQAWSTQRRDVGALDEIRKIVAVGIACMEQHAPPVLRSPSDFAALQGGHAPNAVGK